MSDASIDEHELIARYFDGELQGAEEAKALEHLAQCAQCQAELGDLMGLDVALRRAAQREGAAAAVAPTSEAPTASAQVISLDDVRRRRRRWLAVGALAAAAAAAALWLRRAPGPEGAPLLALAPARSLEMRLAGEPFAAHRPYSVVRGGPARESFALEDLAALERTGRRELLAEAQILTGDLDRARSALAAVPASPARDADLAALELAAGRPEAALEAADRALGVVPDLAPAQWNRALALRELGLAASAQTLFETIAARREPGWSDEAAQKAAALRASLGQRAPAAAAFTSASRAMIDRSGPPLTEADVAARPGLTRLSFHDALRSAEDVEQARALSHLAAALDRTAGNALASRAVARVVAARFDVRAPLAREYRALVLEGDPGRGLALLAKLDRQRGAELDDLRLGAILLAGQTRERRAELRRLVAATEDPWFLLYWPLEEAAAQEEQGAADLAESGLRTAIAGCDARLWAHRCAHLAWRLSALYMTQGRYVEAEQHAEQAALAFRASGALELEDVALSRLAEVRRGLGRHALAAATFQEVRTRLGGRDCSAARYAAAGEAMISVYRLAKLTAIADGDAEACGEPPSRYELAMLVDLARMTGRGADRDRANNWIEAARRSTDPGLLQSASIAAARLDVERDPAAVVTLRAALGALPGDGEEPRAFRAWIVQTLVDAAARRADWKAALAEMSAELGTPPPAACTIGMSLDDTRATVAVLGPSGEPTGAHLSVDAPNDWQGRQLVTPEVIRALAGCQGVSVIARPPLHGRAELLPTELAWSFVGQARRAAPPSAGAIRRTLYVGDVLPPAALALPALAPLQPPAGGDVLRGAEATPARVLEALGAVDYAELHVHGQVDLSIADSSFLALSPGAEKRWALTSALVRTAKLPSSPIVVLAACHAAAATPYEHRRWSLPDAFLAAGARAVIAPTVAIPDDQAITFFAELRQRLAAGAAPAVALAELRAAYVRRGATWAAAVALFE